MTNESLDMFHINEKSRYEFDISINPLGVKSRRFYQALVFTTLWFGFLSFVTLAALQDFQEENYVLVIFWIAGFFHLGISLSTVFARHEIQFSRDKIRFRKNTPFKSKELSLDLIEITKVHGYQALRKNRYRHKKTLDEPKKIRRGIIVMYGSGSNYGFGEHLSRNEQLTLARILNERILERQKFLR